MKQRTAVYLVVAAIGLASLGLLCTRIVISLAEDAAFRGSKAKARSLAYAVRLHTEHNGERLKQSQ